MCLVLAATVAHADDAATFPSGGVAEALRARVGKPVTLHLTSGTQIGGTVAEVRDQTVVLKSLTGREFFDALVVLEAVAAVEVRARDR
jgi:sRNA-binding regulator protein Hfq